jgi:galactitol-specific phosphotransferase system IIB component/glycosyltransferase involved in cell wall biosynthesis
MKLTHWTFFNGSGLANVAVDMAEADRQFGFDVTVCDTNNVETWEKGMDADIHVVHSHIPDKLSFDKSKRIITVQHGAPEHIFQISVEQGAAGGYGTGDSFSLAHFFLKRSNALVTFWPRQAEILETLTDRPIFCIPMGIKKDFWTHQDIPPMVGTPSIFTSENAHTCKWPLDMFLIWPRIVKEIPSARLHAINMPLNQQRWWWPLSYANNSNYSTYMSAMRLDAAGLRNYLSASNFYYSPVRYGDHNRMSLEAAACGTKVISYEGNEYAHYWVREGDQRRQVVDLLRILKGEAEERTPLPVPDIIDTAKAMLQVYKEIA